MPGERVRTADGWATAETLARWWGSQEVQNLEVDRDHRFLVGVGGVVSHNAENCDKTHLTYTEEGPSREIYAGRASVYGTPEQIV